MRACFATITAVEALEAEPINKPSFRFETTLRNGTTRAFHVFSGLEASRLLNLADVCEIADLQGRESVVMYDERLSQIEWYGFADVLGMSDLLEEEISL